MINPTVYLLKKLLEKNDVFFDKQELAFQIQTHPSYPSLHSITGVLDHFNIENVAANVPVDAKALIQLPDCFIAQIEKDNNKDLVLVNKEKLGYSILNSSTKKQKITEDEFLKKFTGIIVAVDQAEENVNPKSSSNTLKFLSVGLSILFASFFIFINLGHWYTVVYFGLCIAGIIASIAIIKQELGLKSSIGDAFCSGQNEKKDCDAVLTSKGAEIIKGYKLSDFSILYFTGLAVLTFIQIANPVISFTISILAIPVTLYSLYYQYVVIKKWCLLCLSIVGVLWTQALFPFITNKYINNFIINDFLVFGIVALAVLLLLNYIKPLFTDVHKLKKEKIESVKFKRNYTLFESLLNKSPQINTELSDSNEIIFGNLNSNLEITLITNPFCGHCKPVHTHIAEILHRYHNSVKVKIRFSVNTKDENSDLVKITSRLIEIYNTTGEKDCLLAMDDIYNEEIPNNWFKKWSDCSKKETYILELEKESNWCKAKTINFTPEILINGKSFPKEYNRSDLMYFIEDLHEDCSNTTIKNIDTSFELNA
jgi:hypothetical protein